MTAVLALIGFVLPLGLDSLAVAAAIGAAGRLAERDRWRIAALFLVFEAGMPVLGLAIGAPLAEVVGPAADYVAAGAVLAIGGWMLVHGESEDEQEKAERLASARGAGLVGLGVSISLDELAIGFSLGLAHLPLVPVLIAIGGQAFIAAQLGLRFGARMAERHREAAERLAGLVLVVLGLVMIAEHLFA
ncbi:MAG TPA: manganese efflux pump [Pseudonocardiaceae bacterium]|jgi:putative Mn2+ efflux pump MntP|nr:manganese efflux pump [Pseudonocardiaceae bacterium]